MTEKQAERETAGHTPGPSLVRRNLLERQGYTPYCGSHYCHFSWPRSAFNGRQFECSCGWTSNFEAEFIEQYQQAQAALSRASGAA